MTKEVKDLLSENERLNGEIGELRLKLRVTSESLDQIRYANIDAVVVGYEKDLKIFTENSADKPFRILIEKMHEGAVTLNGEGTILYCNSYFANMLNLPLQNVIGTKFENYIDDTSKKHFQEWFSLSTENVLKEEISILAGNEKQIPVLMSVNVLQLDDNFVLNIILTDLTDQKENQERLKRRTDQLEQKNQELEIANKELAFQLIEKEKQRAELKIVKTDVKELEGLNTHKESIIGTLSHDLRSPLTGIIGLTELLMENFESLEKSKVKEMLDLLYESSTDELRMLDYLVEWARIKYASETFNPTKIELAEYVKNSFKTLNEIAVRKDIQLNLSIEEKLDVFADGRMLLSILQNIISNSIKHSCAGSEILVSAERKEDKIVVSIKDSGNGMSKERIAKLFIPQLVSVSNETLESKGIGIGLLIVKGFLDKHNCRIWVESTEGAGSTFYFTLPANEPMNLMTEPQSERIYHRAT